MIEHDVEKYLVARVNALGGECSKVKWVGRRGAPDRLVMLPIPITIGGFFKTQGSPAVWVELKAPGQKAKPHKDRMRAMGQRVIVIDSSHAKAIYKAMVAVAQDDCWVPTTENINALPERIRSYVADLETTCDPAGTVRENVFLRDTVLCLEAMLIAAKEQAAPKSINSFIEMLHRENAGAASI